MVKTRRKLGLRIFRLYYWCGGFNDGHRYEREFNNLEELIEYHKKYRPASPLYNYGDAGNDYYEELEKIENEKRVVYKPEIKHEPKNEPKKNSNETFLFKADELLNKMSKEYLEKQKIRIIKYLCDHPNATIKKLKGDWVRSIYQYKTICQQYIRVDFNWQGIEDAFSQKLSYDTYGDEWVIEKNEEER